MKKLLLIISLLFICMEGFSQYSSFTAFSAKKAFYNYNLDIWEWFLPNEVNMLITVSDSKIYVDDAAGSNYTIISNSATTNMTKAKVIKYRAVDEKGKRCNIELVSWNDDEHAPQMYIVYSNVRYAYGLKSK